MIEINLLPEELRKTEGTPPARVLAIFLSVAVACSIGALIGSYYLVKIPNKQQEINTAKADIDSLTKRKTEVEKTRTEITNLREKVKALNNLIQSSVRYGRVLHRLCNAIPDGVWFRTFTVSPDPTPALTPTSGKRYQIALTGYTTGSEPLEMNRKLTELMRNLMREFDVPSSDTPPVLPVGPDYGWCKFINAKFATPKLIGATQAELGTPIDIDPKARITAPKQGLDFQLTLSFELPAAQ